MRMMGRLERVELLSRGTDEAAADDARSRGVMTYGHNGTRLAFDKVSR
jgi:hypothetical protein